MKLASVTGFIAVRSLRSRYHLAAPVLGRMAIVFVACLLLDACSSGGTPPVSDRSRVDTSAKRTAARASRLSSGSYRVMAGDTLYSIAWRHQRDFRDLAALNRIAPPFNIYPGQVLRLKGKLPRKGVARTVQQSSTSRTAARAPAAPARPHPLASTQTKPQSGTPGSSSGGRQNKSGSTTRPQAPKRVAAMPRTGPVQLRWPSSGTRMQTPAGQASGNSKSGHKVDFRLRPGEAIRAAGAGEVVFAQPSLAGFRQFVILKHNDTWLSSYGFNAPLKIKEGQRVAAGATLATLPKAISGRASEHVLRFEVRKNGAAVDPVLVIGP